MLDGQTLQHLVRVNGPLSAREAALVGVDVCVALSASHRVGLAHGGVTADTVLRQHGGRIVLRGVDGRGENEGPASPYTAPEVIAGETATTPSDIYSLGVLLLFLSTGSVALASVRLNETHTTDRPGTTRFLRDVRPDLPRAFVEIVDRALAHVPGDRFASAEEMKRALATVISRASERQEGDAKSPASLLAWTHPARVVAAVVISVLAMMVAVTVAPLSWRGFLARTAPAADRRMAGAVRSLTADQAKIAFGFEELASSLAGRGQWEQSAAQYGEAERIYRLNMGPDAPLVAAALARVAWAHHHAGQFDLARRDYELAIATLEKATPGPILEVALTALASLQQRDGRFADAVTSIDRALTLRAQILQQSADPTRGLSRIGIAPSVLATLMSSHSLADDEDGDWLPDLLEVAVGLRPDSSDTDRDGVPDAEEDHDLDRISNVVEFGLTADPTKIVAHYGAVDPEWSGFQQPANRRFSGRAAGAAPVAASWNVSGPGQLMYHQPLTDTQKATALRRGWRLMARGSLYRGGAFANVDFEPGGPRFDLEFLRNTTDGVDVQLNTSVVPFEGPVEPVSGGDRWTLTELLYDPTVGRATILIDGVRRSPQYAGHKQFQEGLGLFFGTWDVFGKATSGDADLGLVVFVIR